MRKLKLLKAIIQPVFILDKGEHLHEYNIDPVSIAASNWKLFAEEGFNESVKLLQVNINTTFPSMLRLLKVIVQPIFIIGDNKNLIEQPGNQVVIASQDWESFATEGFEKGVEQLIRDFEVNEAKIKEVVKANKTAEKA